MAPVTVALLVIVWSGHDIQPQSMPEPECKRATEAIMLATRIRDDLYAMQSDVSAYCVPMNTGADDVVIALLSPPAPSPKQAAVSVQQPPPK